MTEAGGSEEKSVKTAKTVDNFKVKLKSHFYSVSFA